MWPRNLCAGPLHFQESDRPMKRLIACSAVVIAAIAVLMVGGCPEPDTEPSLPVEDTQPPAAADWPRTFTDALGEEVTLQQPPQRVVCLSTGFTEAIFAMGAGDRLVGRVIFAEYPPEVLEVPSVGGMIDPSLEAIAELEPDLLLTERGTPQDVIESIRRAGVPVLAQDPKSVDEVLWCIREIGRYLGVEDDANALADQLEARAEAATERGNAIASGEGRPSVLFVVSIEPVFVAGTGHFVDDMIDRAGALNAATLMDETSQDQWPSLSLEAIVELDPDIVVIAMMLEEELSEVGGVEAFADRPGWSELPAVKEGRIYTINPDWAVRAGPRLFDAMEQMVEIVESGLSGEPIDD